MAATITNTNDTIRVENDTAEEVRSTFINRLSVLLMLTILIVVGLAQAQNMLEFPYFQDAEGTHVANAWSIMNGGDLSPYTYAYEEPPIGSFVLSIWTTITGGMDTFGFTLNSGRVLMLAMHVMTVALIFGITQKISRSNLAALIATLVFAFSPLATGIQRRILLDNIMVVWLLASFYLILGDNRKISHYFISAGFFGLAVLTKTFAFWFLPAFIFIIRLTAHKHHKRFATNLWLALSLILISFYPLYAQMRQELFPQGWILGGDFPHVSLLERVLDRGVPNGVFLNIGSGLASSFEEWINITNIVADPVIIFGGMIALLFLFVFSIDNKPLRPIIAISIVYALVLIFGGQVFSSDIIIILPFLAMAIGIVIGTIVNVVSGSAGGILKYLVMLMTIGVLLYPFIVFYGNRTAIYTANQVDGQVAAVDWVKENLDEDAVIVTDNFAFVELRQQMPNAHHYWKVDTDPDVKFNILEDNLCNIDYLIVSPQVLQDMNTYNMELMKRTYGASELLVRYENNGWPIEIWQVGKSTCEPELALN